MRESARNATVMDYKLVELISKEGESVFAHLEILKQSPVLKRKYHGDFKDKTLDKLELLDTYSTAEIHSLLDFMYGAIPTHKYTFKDLFTFYEMTDVLALDDFMDQCKKAIVKVCRKDPTILFEALDYEKKHSHPDLKSALLDTLGNNFLKKLSEANQKLFHAYALDQSKQDEALGAALLGLCYEYGMVVEKDRKEAFGLYNLSAEQKNSFGQCFVARCYQIGIGCEKDIKKAVLFYTLSSDQGCLRAKNNLGVCYEKDEGKDLAKAFALYKYCADEGYPYAQTNLGLCFEFGRGVNTDFQQAFTYYTLGDEQGDSFAKYHLAFCYLNGIYVEKNIGKFAELIKEAAIQGQTYALVFLGQCHMFGDHGFNIDTAEAFRLYQLAADDDDSEGQYFLAECYEYGVGTQFDIDKAAELYQKSADKGCQKAIDKLKNSSLHPG